MAYKVAVIRGTDPESTASAERAAQALAEAGHEIVSLVADNGRARELRSVRPDATYLALNNPHGRSGAVQGLLELMEAPFVGAPSGTCRDTWNKDFLGRLWRMAANNGELGAHVPEEVLLDGPRLAALGLEDVLGLVPERVPGGYPLQVRAAHGGSARIVGDDAELLAALGAVTELNDAALVRPAPEGVRVAVAVLGDYDDLQVLPPVEVVRGRRVALDAAGTVGSTQPDYFAPVRLASLHGDPSEAQAIRSELERAALDAYLTCGCRDLGVVDLAWDGARACVLDIDVAPALGEGELLPLACEAAQIPLTEALGALVEIALERGC